MSTRYPSEDIVTAVGEFLTANWNGAVTAFNTATGDGIDVANVTWGNGYSDLLNAQALPVGDVYLGEIELDRENDQATGIVDVAIRAATNAQSDMKKQLTRYADLLWQLIEDNPDLGNRVVIAEISGWEFGINAQARTSGIVLTTVEVTVDIQAST
jgi:hypothetical protein